MCACACVCVGIYMLVATCVYYIYARMLNAKKKDVKMCMYVCIHTFARMHVKIMQKTRMYTQKRVECRKMCVCMRMYLYTYICAHVKIRIIGDILYSLFVDCFFFFFLQLETSLMTTSSRLSKNK